MTLFEYNAKVIDSLADEPDELWEEEFAEPNRLPEPDVTLMTVSEQRAEIAKKWRESPRLGDEITDAIGTMSQFEYAQIISALERSDLLELGRVVDLAIRTYWRLSKDEGF